MVSVTNPLMDSEIWGANLAGKCVSCRSNKAKKGYGAYIKLSLLSNQRDASECCKNGCKFGTS